MAKDWRSAYFAQALSDYTTFRLLREQNAPICQYLHYLQMATEKLAKGFKTSPGAGPHEKTHQALVSFMRLSRGLPAVRQASGLANISAYAAFIDSLLPLARTIEGLAPDEAGDSPNPEYPWEFHGGVTAPVEYAFIDLDIDALANPKLRLLLDFVDRCFTLAVREL